MTSNVNAPTRFAPLGFNDLLALKPAKQLIEGVLFEESVSAMIGASNSGKTFVAIDIGLHVALGKDWFGRGVSQQAVAYIAAEGGVGLQKRLQAFQTYHLLSTPPPFHVITAAPDLGGQQDIDALIASLKTIPNLGLVIIDTLSRTLGGRNENASDVMGPFIAACDRIKSETGSHVMIVHHTGKNPDLGGRGHSSLKGAIDTQLTIKSNNAVRTITQDKQRDLAIDDKLAFELQVIDLGIDAQGNPISSCVVLPILPTSPTGALKPKEMAFLREVRHEISLGMQFDVGTPPKTRSVISISELKSIAAKFSSSQKSDSIQKAAKRYLERLTNAGELEHDGFQIWLPDRQDI